MREVIGAGWSYLLAQLGQDHVRSWGTAIVVALVGLVVARLVSVGLHRALAHRASPQIALLVRRGSFYTLAFLALFSALREAGFDLGVVLGAAGVLTVAIGFASQTSASNVISGLFLLGEQPFVVGDVVEIGATRGEVVSIDLLSVKIRTFQNLYVRVPNENIIKTEIKNLTRYPIRRVDLKVGVAYEADLDHVQAVLMSTALGHIRVLDEPAPLFLILGFGASSVDLQFSVWTKTGEVADVETAMYKAIKRAFEDEGIEIPLQQVVVHQPDSAQEKMPS